MKSEDTSPEKIAARLEIARKRLGWTQEKVAKAIKASPQVISQIEQGVIKESGKLPAIAIALGVPCEWLYAGIGEMDYRAPPLRIPELLEAIKAVLDANLSEKANLDPGEIAHLCLDVYEEGLHNGSDQHCEASRATTKALVRSAIRRKNRGAPSSG